MTFPESPSASMMAPVDDPARRSMTPSIVVVALTLLLGVQPIATDLYLPALPTIATSLGATVSAVQLTLSALVIAFGLGQLVCGPLSDRFGRRPVVLTGLALYTAASVASTCAPDIDWLIAMRVLQGASLAAAITCGRSVIRDLFEPHEGARVLSRALTGVGIIAIAAPVIGSTTVAWISWRASVAATALFGLCALVFCAFNLRETVRARNPQATRVGPLFRSWRTIAANPTFIAYTTLAGLSYVGLFLTLVGSSFVYIGVLGVSKLEYGAIMMINSIGYTAGTMLARRVLPKRGLRGTVGLAAVLNVVSAVALLGASLAGTQLAWLIAMPQWLYGVAHGLHQPCGQAGAIGPFPKAAGTASALSGFFMLAAAFVSGLVYARGFNGTIYPLTLGVAGISIVVAIVAWTLVQRHGDPRVIPDVLPEPA